MTPALRRIGAVARKEIVDAARDRRTMMVSLLSAVLGGPLFLVLMFNMLANQAERARDVSLAVVGRDHAPALMAFLEREQVKLVPAPEDSGSRLV